MRKPQVIHHHDGATDCESCGQEGALMEVVGTGEYFCDLACYRLSQIEAEMATGCTCYSFGGRAMCPFHGD